VARRVRGLWQGATLLLEKHPEYAASFSGAINRNGERRQVAGDIEDGEFTLEESADGVHIAATWVGDVVEGSCGREIRGTWTRGRRRTAAAVRAAQAGLRPIGRHSMNAFRPAAVALLPRVVHAQAGPGLAGLRFHRRQRADRLACFDRWAERQPVALTGAPAPAPATRRSRGGARGPPGAACASPRPRVATTPRIPS
jgi:hypothetical protein